MVLIFASLFFKSELMFLLHVSRFHQSNCKSLKKHRKEAFFNGDRQIHRQGKLGACKRGEKYGQNTPSVTPRLAGSLVGRGVALEKKRDMGNRFLRQ